MQPFDALTIKAILQEAKPLLLNRRVDKLSQLGRDELLLNLRAKAGMINLFLSAHTAHGRLCLVKLPSSGSQNDKSLSRYLPVQKPGSSNNAGAASSFMQVLRKHLTGASLVGVEQPTGERVVNFVFSCTDEVGTASHKVLTAEIMGRHSNLIFWDKASEKILGASHLVTKEMSRQREVLPGLKYVRPPVPEKTSVFAASKDDFVRQLEELDKRLRATKNGEGGASTTNGVSESDEPVESSQSSGAAGSLTPTTDTANATPGLGATTPAASSSGNTAGSIGNTTRQHGAPVTLEQWLIDTYTGLGRHLAEELVHHSKLPSKLNKETFDVAEFKEALWAQFSAIQQLTNFKGWMKKDLSRYSVLGWWNNLEDESEWRQYPSVNDMIEEYFRLLETREQFHQLRERLRSEIKTETEKIQTRLNAASEQLGATDNPADFKKRGDLVLAHVNEITAGQELLICDDLYSAPDMAGHKDQPQAKIEIKLNPNLSPSQNAQNFYRQFAKHRARQSAATMARQEATSKLSTLQRQLTALDQAKATDELRVLRDELMPRKPENKRVPQPEPQNKKPKQRLLQVNSSDNWVIYVGRNRHENDHLLTRLAQPSDVWLHILGQGGAHVLIRVPASKQDPPMSTLKEAALIAARMSKAGHGSKVRVVYTQVRHVKKIAKDKPGLVRYENEKTIEIDTAQPVPQHLKHIFSHGDSH
ncbi:MAG TPA: NFACT RNA binding domain-containing protein [Oculatellaceae cyanobacterium]